MRRIFAIFFCIAIAATFGVMSATSLACGVGLLNGTNTWCGVGYIWIVAIPLAIAFSFIIGLPLHFIFSRFRLRAWWQFGVAGALAAMPIWLDLAKPYASVRWQQSGLYDTIDYIGTGVLAALTYWLLTKHVLDKNGPASVE
jgi:hypothetical protein